MENIFFIRAYAVIFGLLMGSFLNVCILRIPEMKSLGGRSHCPKCQHKLSWYENIPLLSYLFLCGKCRNCKSPISWQYPLIEAISGLLAYTTIIHTQDDFLLFALWFVLFVCPLIVLSVIDFKLQILPDVITLPFILVGFGVVLLAQWPHWEDALIFSLKGVLVGGGSLYLIGTLYYLIKKTDGMGGGDVKLCAMLGAFLGWKSMILIFFIASMLALTFAITLLILSKDRDTKQLIPFGPFLSAAALIILYRGPEVVDFYLHFSGLQ